MPTYEYQCKKCEATFDVFQSIKSKPLTRTRCESCGKVQAVRRLIGTGGAVLFKGSGFYQTDYRSEGYKQKAKSETDSTKPAAESTTKSETAKPETKKSNPSGGKSDGKSGGSKKPSSD